MSTRHVLLPIAVAVASLWSAPVALATYPGGTGVIVYDKVPFDPSNHDGDYLKQGDLFAMAPDGSSEQPFTRSASVPEDVGGFSTDGTKYVYTQYKQVGNHQVSALWTSGPSGTGAVQIGAAGTETNATWSPDGTKVLFRTDKGLYTMDAAGGSLTHLATSSSAAYLYSPRFSADGRSIFFIRATSSGTRKHPKFHNTYWTMGADGTNPREFFAGTGSASYVEGFDVSPDGTRLAFVAAKAWDQDAASLFTVNVDGSGLQRVAKLSTTFTYLSAPAWSPDGRTIAAGINADYPKYGSQIALFDPIAESSTVIKSIKRASVIGLSWQPLPAPVL